MLPRIAVVIDNDINDSVDNDFIGGDFLFPIAVGDFGEGRVNLHPSLLSSIIAIVIFLAMKNGSLPRW